MKKVKIIIIIVFVLLVFFIGYKGYYLNKYNTIEFENEYMKFIELYKNRDQYTIKHNNITEDEYIKFKNIKFKNIFKNYIENNDFEKNNYIEYRLLDNNKSYFSITIDEPIYMSNICSNSKTCFNGQKYMKKNNLISEVDLLKYSYNNQKKITIFSNINEIEDNYIQKYILACEYGHENLEKIKIINGIYSGTVVTTKNTIKVDIDKDKCRYSIFFVNTNIKDKELEDILNSLEIN